MINWIYGGGGKGVNERRWRREGEGAGRQEVLAPILLKNGSGNLGFHPHILHVLPERKQILSRSLKNKKVAVAAVVRRYA